MWVLPRTGVPFPAPRSSSSQPTVIPGQRDPVLWSPKIPAHVHTTCHRWALLTMLGKIGTPYSLLVIVCHDFIETKKHLVVFWRLLATSADSGLVAEPYDFF